MNFRIRSNIRNARYAIDLALKHHRLRSCEFHSGLGDSGWLLHGLVRSMKPSFCVEIGSAHGWSSCLIALALEENGNGELWAFDPHIENKWSDVHPQSTLSSLTRNLKKVGVSHRVHIVRNTTTDGADRLPAQIDIAFIDGDHSYEGVRSDWELIMPRMSEWGVIVFHDSLWDVNASNPDYLLWRRDGIGVPRFLEELRVAGFPLITMNRDWGVTLVQPCRGGNCLIEPKQI